MDHTRLRDHEKEMNTCDTCKYWGTKPGHDAAPHCRSCSCPKNLQGYHPDCVPEDGMLAEDDEGWGFVTGPKFGCVNYYPK